MAFNERWQGVLNRPPPPPEGSLREGLQVHVHDLLAHGDGRGMGRVPLAPDAVGTDVEEFHARSAVITLSQRGDEGAVFGKVNRVGVIRFDARDGPAAAGRIAAAGGSRFSGLRNAAEQLSSQQCRERIRERILTPFRKREAACRAWFGQQAWVPG